MVFGGVTCSHHYHSTHVLFDFDFNMYAQLQHGLGQIPLLWCQDVTNVSAVA